VGILEKLRKARYMLRYSVDVIKRGDTIYIFALPDRLAAAFVYKIYLTAREYGLEAVLMYARYIDEDWIPEDVRRIAERWLKQGLSSEEIQRLRGSDIITHIFNKMCPE